MVYFVGAGTGAADLITVRGMRLLQKADVIIALDTNSVSNWLYYNQDANYFNDFLFKKIYSIHDFFMFHNEAIYLKYFSAGMYRNEFLGVLGIPSNEFNPVFSTTVDNYNRKNLEGLIFSSLLIFF